MKDYEERKRYAEGHSPKEYSYHFGLSIATSYIHYRRFGVKLRVFCDKGFSDEVKDYLSEHSIVEAAKNFKLKYQTVHNFAKRNNLNPPKEASKKIKVERNKTVILLSQNHSNAEIARMMGLSRERIGQILKKYS